jgi:hypothetical protein
MAESGAMGLLIQASALVVAKVEAKTRNENILKFI